MKKYVSLLLFLFSFAVCGAEIIKTPFNKAVSAEQWQVVDLIIKAKPAAANPFTTSFTATFSGPGNVQLEIPGFYNGGDEWIIRFSASQPGDWIFSTKSEIKALNGKSGKLTVTKNTDPEKHGRIITKPEDPQHFYYEDGTPCFLQAFECDWLFALDYQNADGIPKTAHLMKLLEENKINQVVTTMYSFDVAWKKDPKLAQHPEHEYGGDLSIFPFKGTNENPDFSALNVDFFQKYDRVIEEMHKRNISAHLMIYVWNKMVNWPDTESEADNMYYDYIIKRYQAFSNIVWDVSKEALNNKRCTEAYGLERISRIRKQDAYKHLVSVHDYGFCSKYADKVDFISTQNWHDDIHHMMLQHRKDFKNKPIFNIEHGGYEESPYVVFPGSYISPEVCLRRNYLIAFAGAYSTYYWQGTSWNVIIHNPFEQPVDSPKPRFDFFKNMVSFFEKIKFSEFSPSPTNTAYCMRNKENVFLFFVPKEHYQISIYGGPEQAKTGTYQWFNTYTGEYSEEMKFEDQFYKNPWYMDADAILIRKH